MSEVHTATWRQQHDLELTVAGLYHTLLPLDADEREGALPLLAERHVRYLQGALGSLPGGFAALGASRPWICYWALHGLALLGAGPPGNLTPSDVVSFLSSCQDARGGYGGGPGQLPHLAPTYAAVSALVTLGTPEALGSIDRDAMQAFLLRVALPSAQGGGFVMHEGARACSALHMSGCDRQAKAGAGEAGGRGDAMAAKAAALRLLSGPL
jgi:protein farnesyltransferase subunit beta